MSIESVKLRFLAGSKETAFYDLCDLVVDCRDRVAALEAKQAAVPKSDPIPKSESAGVPLDPSGSHNEGDLSANTPPPALQHYVFPTKGVTQEGDEWLAFPSGDWLPTATKYPSTVDIGTMMVGTIIRRPILASLREQLAAKPPEPQQPKTFTERREQLGKRVRQVWVDWAKTQDRPKADWLDPWEALPENIKEVDRRIGCVIWGDAVAEFSSEIADSQVRKLLADQHQQPTADAVEGQQWLYNAYIVIKKRPASQLALEAAGEFIRNTPHPDTLKVRELERKLAEAKADITGATACIDSCQAALDPYVEKGALLRRVQLLIADRNQWKEAADTWTSRFEREAETAAGLRQSIASRDATIAELRKEIASRYDGPRPCWPVGEVMLGEYVSDSMNLTYRMYNGIAEYERDMEGIWSLSYNGNQTPKWLEWVHQRARELNYWEPAAEAKADTRDA